MPVEMFFTHYYSVRFIKHKVGLENSLLHQVEKGWKKEISYGRLDYEAVAEQQ